MKYNPLYAIPKSFLMLIAGKASFPKDRVGEIITRDDDVKFRVFREIQIKIKKDRPATPDGVFQVCLDFGQNFGSSTMRQKNLAAFTNG